MHLVSKAAMKMGYCTFPRWSRGSLSNSCSNWGSEISRPNLWRRSEEGQPCHQSQSTHSWGLVSPAGIKHTPLIDPLTHSGVRRSTALFTRSVHRDQRTVNQGIRLHIHVCTPSNIHLDKLQPSLAPEITDKDKWTYQTLWIKLGECASDLTDMV